MKKEKQDKCLREIVDRYSYVRMRLPRIIETHFSWTNDAEFPSLSPLSRHINLVLPVVNVNNVNPIKHSGKPS